MNAETTERAFDPFFPTKDIGSDSGLGLYAVKGAASLFHPSALEITN